MTDKNQYMSGMCDTDVSFTVHIEGADFDATRITNIISQLSAYRQFFVGGEATKILEEHYIPGITTLVKGAIPETNTYYIPTWNKYGTLTE